MMKAAKLLEKLWEEVKLGLSSNAERPEDGAASILHLINQPKVRAVGRGETWPLL
jgi:hypothetical protein